MLSHTQQHITQSYMSYKWLQIECYPGGRERCSAVRSASIWLAGICKHSCTASAPLPHDDGGRSPHALLSHAVHRSGCPPSPFSQKACSISSTAR